MAINSIRGTNSAAVNSGKSAYPEAFGGTESNINIGTVKYKVHQFLATGNNTLIVPYGNLENVEYLLVAGGGAGGPTDGATYTGGGGGAGGLIQGTGLQLSANTNYTISVGAGGTGVTNTQGTAGGNTTAFGFTAIGGGGGGYARQSTAGGAGGSGGSGGAGGQGNSPSGVGGAGTTSQGFAGATGASLGSSGGGAGSVGTTAVYNTTPTNGLTLSITGSAVHYASGGATINATQNGAANTGQGGYGRGDNTANLLAGAGGSGIVVIRYRIA